MACNFCENTFQVNQSLVVSINRSGSTANLYVGNQGRNIVLIRRILLCYGTTAGSTVLYLRYPDTIQWIYPSTYLEPGLTTLYYSLTGLPTGAIVQAQAEYIEIEGRARSCVA